MPFSAAIIRVFRLPADIRAALSNAAGARAADPRTPPAPSAGFLLIEVVISALLAAAIVVATFTGLEAANRATTDQRLRTEASTLATQSQAQLRSDPVTALEGLESGVTHTESIGGQRYTITQKTSLQPPSGAGECSVTKTKRQAGATYSISTAVKWTEQERSRRPPILLSSFVTPPTGSGLEIDADNDPAPTAGVPGIPTAVKYTPQGSTQVATVERTTNAQGCAVYTGIPATVATVEIAEVAGFVTRSGALRYPTKEVTVAPNYTTHDAILYNQAGKAKVEFAWAKKGGATAKYSHAANNGSGTVEEEIAGDTFVVSNAKMEAAPDLEQAATQYGSYAGGYRPEAGTYAATAFSPTNLFPFSEAEKGYWTAYAGDCEENEPAKVTGNSVQPAAKLIVPPGGSAVEQVPTSYLLLDLYRGTWEEVKGLGSKAWEDLETTTSRPAVVTNLRCASAPTPDDETGTVYEHRQQTTVNGGPLGEWGGHLAHPFLPFASEMQLCVYVEPNTYTTTFPVTSETPSPVSIYIKQKSGAEWVAKAAAEKTREETQLNEELAKGEITQSQYKEKKKKLPNKTRVTKEEAEKAAEIEKSHVTVEKNTAGCP